MEKIRIMCFLKTSNRSEECLDSLAILMVILVIIVLWAWSVALHEKCLYSEFFWSVFSHIWTEYGKIRIQSKYGKIQTKKTPITDTFHAVPDLKNTLTRLVLFP